MKLNFLDFIVILLYVASVVFIGIYHKRRAERNKSEYLLGGNKLPWYALGISDASGMFDISGTMWLVTLLFVYGFKSVWLPWLWPTFNQIFLMMFLSSWLRKSNVTTGAEWIKTRFGNDNGSKLSHIIIVIFAMIGCLGFLAYGYVGLGKFLEIFVPWSWLSGKLGISINAVKPENVAHIYGIFFTLLATFYAILGGMLSIVWADVLQYAIMTVASILIGFIAFMQVSPDTFHNLVPEGWMSPFFGKTMGIDWSNIISEVNERIQTDGYSLFSLVFGMMLFKGIFVSLAGPAPNYDMQKLLASKSPTDGMKLSGTVSVVLNPVRYLMIAGFAVLAICSYNQLNLHVGGKLDFEQILPSAMLEFIPAGLLGLVLAGLLAAFMSTFAGTLNAAQAYATNDLYLKYINPNATNKQVKNSNYVIGLSIVSLSILLGFFITNINQILQILVSAFFGSYVGSNVLKWYWWRFNSYGYFWGMMTGIIAGFIPVIFPGITEWLFPTFAPDIRILLFFPFILLFSIIGCLYGTYAYPATEEKVLIDFYKNVKPWGFWNPIYEKIKATDSSFEKNKRFWKDMFNVFIGIIWQVSLVLLPIYFVIHEFGKLFIVIGIIAITSVILKFTWWNKLDEI